MNEDFESEVFAYIERLKALNQQLLRGLEQCIMLLMHFKSAVSDPEGFQAFLDEFQELIGLVESGKPELKIH